MFNPLTPAQVVQAIGRTARDQARADAPGTEFARGQLLSAFSAARHLAVEVESFDAELRAFAQDVAQVAADERAAALNAAAGAAEIGELVCKLLAELRAAGDVQGRARVQARLAALANREVDLLSEAIEGSSE